MTIELYDENRGEKIPVETKIWNETIANLTLMALGSSAPEILLNLILTAQNPAEEPSELGPSTIVGSASFNLLVISGVSIIAVEETPKKIARMGVFAVTSITSLFAYVWLFLVLVAISPEKVEMWEAVLTFIFFPILLIVSFGADKANQYMEELKADDDAKQKKALQERQSGYKAKLRKIADEIGIRNVCFVAKDMKPDQQVTQAQREEIKKNFQEILETKNISGLPIADLEHVIKPDSLLERFAYRNKGQHKSEFLQIKGQKGQIENKTVDADDKDSNPNFGFKCLHYSVTESAGNVEITIIRKDSNAKAVGVRTRDSNATAGKDYHKYEQILNFDGAETQQTVKIGIINDEEWNPDLDFYV